MLTAVNPGCFTTTVTKTNKKKNSKGAKKNKKGTSPHKDDLDAHFRPGTALDGEHQIESFIDHSHLLQCLTEPRLATHQRGHVDKAWTRAVEAVVLCFCMGFNWFYMQKLGWKPTPDPNSEMQFPPLAPFHIRSPRRPFAFPTLHHSGHPTRDFPLLSLTVFYMYKLTLAFQ